MKKIMLFCLCLSEDTVKVVGSFYLVSVSGEVKDPMQVNEKKTCDGLTNSREGLS